MAEAQLNPESGACSIQLHMEAPCPEVHMYLQISVPGTRLKGLSSNCRQRYTEETGTRKLFSCTCSAGEVL